MSDPLFPLRNLMGRFFEILGQNQLVLTEFVLAPSLEGDMDVIVATISIPPEALMTPEERQARADNEVLAGMEAAMRLEEEHQDILAQLDELEETCFKN